MYTYEFYGTVHPVRGDFSLNGVPEVRLSTPELEGSVRFEIRESLATIEFSSEFNVTEKMDLLPFMRETVKQYISYYLDAYCYARSENYELELVGMRCAALKLDSQFSLQLERDVAGDPAEFVNGVMHLADNNPDLARVLRNAFADFRRGIKYHLDCGLYFYRAVETIKSNFFDDSWAKMNQALGLVEADYAQLNAFRRPNAHGVFPSITGRQRIQLAKDARKIIDAFIRLKPWSTPLS